MMTKKLSTMLASAGGLTQRRDQCQRQIAKIIADKDRVIEQAKGPDDEAALERLNALSSQESLAQRQLTLAERELAGLSASLVNEATTVRNATLAALRKKRDALMAELDERLTPFYPNARDRKKAIESLEPTPPALFKIGKFLSGIASDSFTPGDKPTSYGTETGYATAILNSAERALAESLN